jgi:hypothetical protein
MGEMRMSQEMTISREDKKQFKDVKTSYLFNGEYTEDTYKVRDHDHRTGRYKGAAHIRCNILHYPNR